MAKEPKDAEGEPKGDEEGAGPERDPRALREMADRYKAQRDAARVEAESIKDRLAKLEGAAAEVEAAKRKAEEEQALKRGEFEKLAAEKEARIRAAEDELKGFRAERDARHKKADAEVERLLEGREDAEQIRADFGDLAPDRRLELVQRYVISSNSGEQQAGVPPQGKPKKGGNASENTLDADEVAWCKTQGIKPEEYIEHKKASILEAARAKQRLTRLGPVARGTLIAEEE